MIQGKEREKRGSSTLQELDRRIRKDYIAFKEGTGDRQRRM
jgi:hypothetical protein